MQLYANYLYNTFSSNQYKDSLLNVETEIFYCFCFFKQTYAHLEFNASNTYQKLGELHIHHYVASPHLLTTHCLHLGIEDTNLCSSENEIFSHFFPLIYDCSFSIVWGFLCCMFHLIKCQMFSVDNRCELQADQLGMWNLL